MSEAPPNSFRADACKSFHRRVKLLREDSDLARAARIPALSAAWTKAHTLQTRPVVVNALVASAELKRLLVRLWGPGAVSLGTTAVERAWWPDHLRNMNKAASWATTAWQQYRAVVSWKQDVVAKLRRAETTARKGRCGGKFLASLEQTLHVLEAGGRQSIRLGRLGGRAVSSDRPRCPPQGELYPGQNIRAEVLPRSVRPSHGFSRQVCLQHKPVTITKVLPARQRRVVWSKTGSSRRRAPLDATFSVSLSLVTCPLENVRKGACMVSKKVQLPCSC